MRGQGGRNVAKVVGAWPRQWGVATTVVARPRLRGRGQGSGGVAKEVGA